METILIISVVLFVISAHLIILVRKLRRNLKNCLGITEMIDDNSKTIELLPKLPYVERHWKYKDNNSLEKNFLLYILKELNLDISGLGESDGDNFTKKERDAYLTATHQVFKVFSNSITQMCRESPELMRFISEACGATGYLTVKLANGECVFEKEKHPDYTKFTWDFSMHIFFAKKHSQNKYPYAALQLESFQQESIMGKHRLGAIPISINELTNEAAGQVCKSLLSLAQPDTAVSTIMTAKDLSYAKTKLNRDGKKWFKKAIDRLRA